MAMATDYKVKITYEGTVEAVEALDHAFKEKTSKTVRKALAFVKKYGGTADMDARSFEVEEVETQDRWDQPDAFVSLGKQFPGAAFIFDFSYNSAAAGWFGRGRYYCVYENGRKVYDADNWLEHYGYLNWWLETLGVEGDFYHADYEESLQLFARGRLAEQGKKAEEITAEDVEAFLEDFDEGDSLFNSGLPCAFAEFLVDGKDYYEWSRDLDGGGYDAYCELKKEGELPCLAAEYDRRFSFDAAKGDDEDEDDVEAEDNEDNGDGEDEADDEDNDDDEEEDDDDGGTGEAIENLDIEALVKLSSELPEEEEEESDYNSVEDVLDLLAKKGGYALSDVPKRLRTPEVCLAAVKSYGEAFEYVPKKLRTAELCLEAVKADDAALQYVPEGLRTAKLCLEAVKSYGEALRYVPERLSTAELWELCLEAVKANGAALEDVPEGLREAELCLEAVKSYGTALKHVPKGLRTAELCRLAVENAGFAIEYVPEHLVTAELALAAAERGSRLSYIPKKFRTIKVCLTVVARSESFRMENVWEFVPSKIRDTVRELHEKGVRPEVLPGPSAKAAPEAERAAAPAGKKVNGKAAAGNKANGDAAANLTNEEEVLEAIEQSGIKFEDVPKNLRTAKVCLAAMKEELDDVLPNVPQKFWEDKDFCLSAIGLNYDAGEYVPEEIWTPEFSWKAVDVSACGLVFPYVPEELRHSHLCLFALKQDPDGSWYDIMEYVPEELKERVEKMFDAGIKPDFNATLSGDDDGDDDDSDSTKSEAVSLGSKAAAGNKANSKATTGKKANSKAAAGKKANDKTAAGNKANDKTAAGKKANGKTAAGKKANSKAVAEFESLIHDVAAAIKAKNYAGVVAALNLEKWPAGVQKISGLDLSAYYVLRARNLTIWAKETDSGLFKISKDSKAKYEQAIADSQKALELRPQNADALYQIGLAYYYLGENTKALNAIDGCLKLNPGHKNANTVMGWVAKELKLKKK